MARYRTSMNAQLQQFAEVTFDNFTIPRRPWADRPYLNIVPRINTTNNRDVIANQALFKAKAAGELKKAADFLFHSGVTFTARIELSANQCGFKDEIQFLKAFDRYNAHMRRFFTRERKVLRKQFEKGPTYSKRVLANRHNWISVVEYDWRDGLKVHQLCVVPEGFEGRFKNATREWWMQNSPVSIETIRSQVCFVDHCGFGCEMYVHAVMVVSLLEMATKEQHLRDENGNSLTASPVVWLNEGTGGLEKVDIVRLMQISSDLNAEARQKAGFISQGDREDPAKLVDAKGLKNDRIAIDKYLRAALYTL